MLEGVRVRSRSYLPHWGKEGGTYFVTFRLAGSLPRHVLEEWERERRQLLESMNRGAGGRRSDGISACVGRPGPAGKDAAASLTACATRAGATALAKRLRALFSAKVDAYLDAGHGECWMKQPEIADLVENGLLHFAGQRYELHAWCVMANHVHAVTTPLEGYELSQILHSWKSYTASQANRLLSRRRQPFWQVESFDHLVRDEEDLVHCVEYTEHNPVTAGLCSGPEDWRWGSARRRLRS